MPTKNRPETDANKRKKKTINQQNTAGSIPTRLDRHSTRVWTRLERIWKKKTIRYWKLKLVDGKSEKMLGLHFKAASTKMNPNEKKTNVLQIKRKPNWERKRSWRRPNRLRQSWKTWRIFIQMSEACRAGSRCREGGRWPRPRPRPCCCCCCCCCCSCCCCSAVSRRRAKEPRCRDTPERRRTSKKMFFFIF